jgi:hypothetical protein
LEELDEFVEPQAEGLPAASPRDEELVESEAAMTQVEDLPEVITADMLRARKKGIDFTSGDFEVPAELLVGLDDEDIDEDDIELAKGKGKAKAKGKAAKKGAKPDAKGKGKKWRPPLGDEF